MKEIRGGLVIIMVLAFNVSFSQGDTRGPIPTQDNGVLDGVYMKEHIPTKKIIPYEFVREADVTWSKRVWRVVDLREKFNHPLYYPLDVIDDNGNWFKNNIRHSLWTVIRTHLLNGELTLYSDYNPVAFNGPQDGDQFKYPRTIELEHDSLPGTALNFEEDKVYRDMMISYIGYYGPQELTGEVDENGDEIMIPDPDFPGDFMPKYPPRPEYFWQSKDIIQYKLKEDWFFDKERGQLDVRIIGIAPVRYEREIKGDPTSTIIGTKTMFWLYFPECRYVFQNYYVQSRNNDAQRMSFDDLFWKRMFTSYIEKESNLYDRDIDSYQSGVNALLESEKIKDKIFRFEHDLWSF